MSGQPFPSLEQFDTPENEATTPLVRVGQGDFIQNFPADGENIVAPGTPGTPAKNVLTYSALNTFRGCPRKFKHRYVDHLKARTTADSLSFGSVIHAGLELWYRTPASDVNRLWKLLDYVDRQFPARGGDPEQKHTWQLARAMLLGYATRYANEEFEVVVVEKEFVGQIRNPDTNRASQTFVMAGKVDGIVRMRDGLYLLEHKTAATIDGNYLDKLWSDTQIALYCFYLRQMGYPIVGVLYNVLLKTRLAQKAGETPDDFEARHAMLAAKNKSGRSTAQRHEAETDDEFQARLAAWYAEPDAFHREHIYLSEDRMNMLQDEVWEITQQYLDARRRGKWLLNTSNCFSYQRPCDYLHYCQSGFNPNVRDNLFDVVPPHTELTELTIGRTDAAAAVPSDNPVF